MEPVERSIPYGATVARTAVPFLPDPKSGLARAARTAGRQVGSGTTFWAARVSTQRGIKSPFRLTVEGTERMTLRLPLTLASGQKVETGWDVLGHEIAQQKVQTLGILNT
jgi:hypothetical protein